jgi:hypothetical protein
LTRKKKLALIAGEKAPVKKLAGKAAKPGKAPKRRKG